MNVGGTRVLIAHFLFSARGEGEGGCEAIIVDSIFVDSCRLLDREEEAAPMARRVSTIASHVAPAGADEPMILSEMQGNSPSPLPRPPAPRAGALRLREARRAAGRVCVIQLNRPKALNALCDQLLSELQAALDAAAADVGCGCVIITGNGRAFAAGADITELRPRTLAGIIADEFPGPCAPKPPAARRPAPVPGCPAGSRVLTRC